MAIYHHHVTIIGRSSSNPATASMTGRASYIHRTGPWAKRANELQHSEVLAPDHAPEWARASETLWQAVEERETRKDAQLGREVEVSLPNELNKEQHVALVRGYASEAFVSRGMVADCAIHYPEPKTPESPANPHAHILITDRAIEENGEWSRYKSGGQNQPWNKKDTLRGWRESWADHCNGALREAGHSETVDHRTLEAQGIDRKPGVHIGSRAWFAETHGIETERGEKALSIDHKNAVSAFKQTGQYEAPTSTMTAARNHFHEPAPATSPAQEPEPPVQEQRPSAYLPPAQAPDHGDARGS